MATRRTATNKTAAKPTKAQAAAKAKPKAKAKPSIAAKVAKGKTKPKAKAAAKPKVAKVPTPKGPSKVESIGPKVVKLRDEGLTFREIGEKIGVAYPMVVLAHKVATATTKDKAPFKGLDGKDLGKAIVEARDKRFTSWFDLQAFTGKSQQTIKKLYTEASGKPATQGDGFDVMRKMMAAKVAEKGGTVKGKTKAGTKNPAKAKRATARKARTSTKGSPNPSKG